MGAHDWMFDVIREVSDAAAESDFLALAEVLEEALDVYLWERAALAQGQPIFRSHRDRAAVPLVVASGRRTVAPLRESERHQQIRAAFARELKAAPPPAAPPLAARPPAAASQSPQPGPAQGPRPTPANTPAISMSYPPMVMRARG